MKRTVQCFSECWTEYDHSARKSNVIREAKKIVRTFGETPAKHTFRRKFKKSMEATLRFCKWTEKVDTVTLKNIPYEQTRGEHKHGRYRPNDE